MEALIFELEGRRWALPLERVHEVARAVRLDPLVGGDTRYEGTVVLHGAPVPVLDLRRWLGFPPVALSPEEHLVFASRPGGLVAFRVDRALGVVEVEESVETDRSAYARVKGEGEMIRLLREPGAEP
jgi:chemotaxis signal transduction protein